MRRAIVYIRQSTPRQVLKHQESARRQYQVAERARQMGWACTQVEVIDEDLGLSGASITCGRAFSARSPRLGWGRPISFW